MRSTTFLVVVLIATVTEAQIAGADRDTLVNVSISVDGELIVIPSKNSSSHDFDFLSGSWTVANKRLKTRLNNSTEWFQFESSVNNRILLNGTASFDRHFTADTGTPYETLSLRVYNPATRLWSSYWVDGKTGVMDPPVIGSFEGNIGTFYGKNIYNGISVLVMFRWDKTNPEEPVWSQAYSIDKGKTWEWNSHNLLQKIKNEHDTVDRPETFIPKIISTDSTEFNSAFSPDGNYFYFSRRINSLTKIFFCGKKGSSWSAPEQVSFSTTEFSDADPAFAPTGELYFISNRPRNSNDTTIDYDIWKVIPRSVNQWSEPINVTALNSEQDEFYISFTKQGDAYLSSSREGGYGAEDIYYATYKNTRFARPVNLGDKINTVHSEYDPFITADQSALIFTSSGRDDGVGKSDLYWSMKASSGWYPAKHFDQTINTSTRDFCPYITSDRKYFFYSSQDDVKFIPIDKLPVDLRSVLKK